MKKLVLLAFVLQLAAGCSGTIRDTVDDAAITARVKTVLLNDREIGASKIDVTTANGIVTISGSVKSKDEESRAIQLANGVGGVKEVRSTLRVES
jgi:hyperosmotically inducible protein